MKNRDYFVGIDSDGCVFDTMEVKHKECFIPAFVAHFGLASISRHARQVAEFVNLYSVDRGINRFPGYLKVLSLLIEHPEVLGRGMPIPRLDGLREWVKRETRLANPALSAEVERTNHPDLALALAWSEDVNRIIGRTVRDVPPFPWVRESLELLTGQAEVMVVSATPGEALIREWDAHGLLGLVGLIAGQEQGTKTEVLRQAVVNRYRPENALMIGDAPGDRVAAESNGILFYPIDPGFEADSWQRFHDEALPKFLDGSYAGRYMDERIARFDSLLPSHPPWNIR